MAKTLWPGHTMAVIKANAYGHGAVHCARALSSEADGFAVSSLEEAIELREAGIIEPILLLEGFFSEDELACIVEQDLWLVIHAQWQVDILLAARLPNALQVWLKMDSGMHRLGLSPKDYKLAFEQLRGHKNVAKLVPITHLANADTPNSDHSMQQAVLFQRTLADLAPCHASSLANSAALLAWPKLHQTIHNPVHWSRPGIMLYGAHPILASTQAPILEPVMQFSSRIIALRHLEKGDTIGYGSLYKAEQAMRVGVVACGYADGYPRSAKTGTPIAVDGHMTQLLGRVSMDMLYVDLSIVPSAGINSHVELWGKQVSANLVAQAAGTIAYELFCNVKRAHFDYFDPANI
jgi:alanine racemase